MTNATKKRMRLTDDGHGNVVIEYTDRLGERVVRAFTVELAPRGEPTQVYEVSAIGASILKYGLVASNDHKQTDVLATPSTLATIIRREYRRMRRWEAGSA